MEKSSEVLIYKNYRQVAAEGEVQQKHKLVLLLSSTTEIWELQYNGICWLL